MSQKSLNSRKPEIVIKKLDQEQLSKFLVRSSEFAGFSIIEGYEREYDNHPSFFHVLGHMGYLTEADVEYFSPRINSFDPSIWRKVGKSGVERVFEEELRGSHGKRFYQRNARGTKRVITRIIILKGKKIKKGVCVLGCHQWLTIPGDPSGRPPGYLET